MDVLTVDQLKQGTIRPLNNARELVDEAKLMHDNQHWARLVFLAEIAGEESGKYPVLASALADLKTAVSELETGRQKSLYADITEGRFCCSLELYSDSIGSNALKRGRVVSVPSVASKRP